MVLYVPRFQHTVKHIVRIGVIGALNRARLPARNILPEEMKALKQLTKDEEIVILPADK